MELVFSHGWVIAIAVTILNGLYLKYRSKEYISADPSLEKGYDKYFKGFVLYCNIPWLIMGLGNISGMTSSVFDYFYPSEMNLIVLIFHATIIILWISLLYWVFLKDGAKFIEQHPGLSRSNSTENELKIFTILAVLGGIFGMLMMWFSNIPAPKI